MKKIIAACFSIFAFFELSYFLQAATIYQPRSVGIVSFSYSTGTVAAIMASTAPTIGYPVWCTNCAANGGFGTVCTSTGATKFGSFVLSTGTACQ